MYNNHANLVFFLPKKEARVRFEPGTFSIKEKYLMPYTCSISKACTSTAFATEAAGIIGRLVHISALCLLCFKARLMPPTCKQYSHHIRSSSMVMSYMN